MLVTESSGFGFLVSSSTMRLANPSSTLMGAAAAREAERSDAKARIPAKTPAAPGLVTIPWQLAVEDTNHRLEEKIVAFRAGMALHLGGRVHRGNHLVGKDVELLARG